jgi:hypothetical protein
MLEYLVTSRTRRVLLHLLWVKGRGGSVSALAREAGVNFSAAHRELNAMSRAGLARAERVGPALWFRANSAHPRAGTLRSLLAPVQAAARAEPPVHAQDGSPEDRVIDDLVASHQSEAVALALPRAIWRQRDTLDYRRLRREAIRRNEAHALGFFLQLTGRLGGDLRLVRRAGPLRDGRRTASRPFFAHETAGARPLPAALRWGYVVDIELARFAAAFRSGGR